MKIENMKLIYPAFSKHNFYFREHISKYILEQKCVPLNPFMIFQCFMLDTIPREVIRNANNNLVTREDELWVFGQVSNGVLDEIKLSRKLKKLIRYFEIINSTKIKEIPKEKVKFETGLEKFTSEL